MAKTSRSQRKQKTTCRISADVISELAQEVIKKYEEGQLKQALDKLHDKNEQISAELTIIKARIDNVIEKQNNQGEMLAKIQKTIYGDNGIGLKGYVDFLRIAVSVLIGILVYTAGEKVLPGILSVIWKAIL